MAEQKEIKYDIDGYDIITNALMTLQEYLTDYAAEETKVAGEKLIEQELKNIPHQKTREICSAHIEEIKTTDNRDFRF